MTNKTSITIGKNAPDFLATMLIEQAELNSDVVEINDERETATSKEANITDNPDSKKEPF